jgi:hypothetical protein
VRDRASTVDLRTQNRRPPFWVRGCAGSVDLGTQNGRIRWRVVLTALLVALAVVGVVVLGLVVVGRETFLLRSSARPAVFDLEEAVDFIADRLPEDVAGRLTHDDVRWILRADVDLLEQASEHQDDEVVDEVDAVARIIERADAEEREVEDADVAAVLAGRGAYLEAIGAVGPEAA